MNKLVLKDSSVVENLLEMNGLSFAVNGGVDDVPRLFNQLSEDNLEYAEIKDDNDNVLNTWENKELSSISYADGRVFVNLANIDMSAKKIRQLEDAIDMLNEAMLGE